jgi:hypothetical protein
MVPVLDEPQKRVAFIKWRRCRFFERVSMTGAFFLSVRDPEQAAPEGVLKAVLFLCVFYNDDDSIESG